MDQNKRTKLLAGALGVIMVFQFLKPHEKVMAPIRKASKDLERAEEDLQLAMDQDMDVMLAEANVDRGQTVSLPPSPTDAMRVYQKWITNLSEQCRFAALKVTPGQIDNRADRYITVNVQVEAEVGLEDLTRFMYLFDQADLKHRITSLTVESSGSTGTPRMDVILTAQGMSVAGAKPHDDVFPLTTLNEAITADATTLTVESSESFPEKLPFMVQVGMEMVEVTDRDQTSWTINRAVQGTQATDHAAEDYVQLFPIRYQEKPITFDDYQNFVASSPFVKPPVERKLNPRIAGLTDKTIAPGESVALTVSTVDVDSDVGEITYVLEDAVEGMTIDSATGEFQWQTTVEAEAKTYSPKIIVKQKNNEDLELAGSFNVVLKVPNNAPTLDVASEAVVVLGQSFELGLEASDDGDSDTLKFSLEGDVPDGLSVDSSARKLTWIPAKTFSPGEYDVTVKVTDSGDPAKSATESVKLKVQDDTAVYMKLTGSVSLDGKPAALFRNLISADNPRLTVGEKVEASEISATITEISGRYILMKDEAGVWRLELGQSLRDRELIEPVEKPETEPETDESAEEKAEEPDDSLKPDSTAKETDESSPVKSDTVTPAAATEAATEEADKTAADAKPEEAVSTGSDDTTKTEASTEVTAEKSDAGTDK